jgi:hypothetical protein
MHRTPVAGLAALLASLAATVPVRGLAQEMTPPASEWRSYCQAYLKALDGDAAGNDLDVTYCLGVTKGLLNGLRIGSQIGALSFGSRLAIDYKLDPDEVFKRFQQQDPSRLMGICSPPAAGAADYVRALLCHLYRIPKTLQRPLGEAIVEGLPQTIPCD